ncbi:hypothetical protein [Demequina lutea]|uniref:Uncharacterized protein n=1 Tax=Demequina lutea TaxID=431489 RepID=A0A7Y9ZEN1_9MICO|nr:hypothetical protein [Demequina lutea]NYI41996.1 hypothetical protein [Demequina lutea]
MSERLLDDLDVRACVTQIEPGKVFDRTVGMSRIPDASRTMERREALEVVGVPARNAACVRTGSLCPD